MARGWKSVALTISWLGLCASAVAQPLPPAAGSGPTAATAGPPGLPAAPVPVPASAAPAPPPAGPESLGPLPPGGPFFPPGCGPEACPPPPEEEPVPAVTNTLCEPCRKGPCFHVSLEYLYWFTRKDSFPPLLTTGSLTDRIPGALGQPHTQVLLQGSDLDTNQHSGGRLTLGYGLDSNPNWSWNASAFYLEQITGSRSFASNQSGSPQLTRPFNNVIAATEDADPVALPAIMAGNISFNDSRRLYGGDTNVRYHYWQSGNSRIALLLGGRILVVEEGLNITENSQDLPGLGVVGNTWFLNEQFNTQNIFYGGQVGAEYEFRVGPAFFNAVGKCAAGWVDETITNRAFTQVTLPNGQVAQSANSALYVNPDNAGRFRHTTFAVVPEGNFKLGFDFTENIRLTFGYDILYLSHAVRPGTVLDRNVNVQPVGAPFGIPPAALPPSFASTGIWAQGFDVGLRFSF
jgi:hypothetical protein